jgi:hypothetical protein
MENTKTFIEVLDELDLLRTAVRRLKSRFLSNLFPFLDLSFFWPTLNSRGPSRGSHSKILTIILSFSLVFFKIVTFFLFFALSFHETPSKIGTG